MPPGTSFGSRVILKLKVLGANGFAAIGLSTLHGLREGLLKHLARSIGQIARGHHVLGLDEVLDLGCNNVTHGGTGE